MTPEFPYVELPGGYRGFLRKASLWEGADHILSVKGSRFNEEYRRFYYRDIQALIVEKRARSGSLGWWVILASLFFVSLVAAAYNDPPYSGYAAGALFVAIVIRLDLSLRKSCRCSIQTAVSRELLPSLIRRAATAEALARLRGRIASAQGELPEEMPISEEEVVAATRPPDSAGPSPASALAEAAAQERQRSAVSGVTFAIIALSVLLVNCAYTFWASSLKHAIAWLPYVLIAGELILGFSALRHIAGIRSLTSLRVVLIAVVILNFLRLLLTPEIARVRLPRNYGQIDAALLLVFATCGLILIVAKWRTYRRGEP